jgi:hypothetical protein
VFAGFTIDVGLIASFIGLASAVIIWFVASLIACNHVTARASSRLNYQQINERLANLKYRIKALCPSEDLQTLTAENGLDEASKREAYAVIKGQIKDIEDKLRAKGMPWVTGAGYIELWNRIHRAEEQLIKLEPLTEVAGGAMQDDERLRNATMENSDRLLDRLRSAVAVLDAPNANGYLRYLPQSMDHEVIMETLEPEVQNCLRAKAIAILAETRYEINSFRDSSWEGIVNVRNRLVETSVVLTLTTYVLLVLTLATSPEPHTILWIAVYFLVGAVIGLFAQARTLWNAASAVSDFGLSTARMLHTPWLAGLAAVGGVLVTALLGPQFTPAAASSTAPTLADIFNGGNTSLLIVAAVFGLAPDLLIQRLAQEAEKFKGDLESTQFTQRRPEGT